MAFSITDIVAIVATVLSVPSVVVAVVTYRRAKIREARDKELVAYHTISSRYQSFLELCISHPEADVFCDRSTTLKENTSEWRVRVTIIAILIDVFETAFVVYEDQTTAWKKRQWSGWIDYIDFWVQKPSFQQAAAVLKIEFMDGEFFQLLSSRMREKDKSFGQVQSPV